MIISYIPYYPWIKMTSHRSSSTRPSAFSMPMQPMTSSETEGNRSHAEAMP